MKLRVPVNYDASNHRMYIREELPELSAWDRLQCRLGIHRWHRAYHKFLEKHPDGNSYWQVVEMY